MKFKVLLVVICLMSAGVFQACAAKAEYVNLVETGGAKVEILPSMDRNISLSQVTVNQQKERFTVSGNAITNGPLFATYKGHIDIVVVGPDKKAMNLRSAEYTHFPSRNRISSFEVHFPVAAEDGTTVRLLYHSLDDAGSRHAMAVNLLESAPCLELIN